MHSALRWSAFVVLLAVLAACASPGVVAAPAAKPAPGPPRVLYVPGERAPKGGLTEALRAHSFEVDVGALPAALSALEPYDLLIVGESAAPLSDAQQAALDRYVRELGGGLVFAGGPRGYTPTASGSRVLEQLLPVLPIPPPKEAEPPFALSLVIDRSGSMSGVPMEAAKEAAKATADALPDDALLEVIAFDSVPTRVVALTPARNRARIKQDIAGIRPGGGTELVSALQLAVQDLRAVHVSGRHVVLLTDGQAPSEGLTELLSAMATQGITASAVALGGGADDALLRKVAEQAGGRLWRVSDPNELPRVFTREAEMIGARAAVEDDFFPVVVSSADFLHGIDLGSAPYLHGIVATKMKPPPAQELLQSEKQAPVLARWRAGRGWVVAWTSDLEGPWAAEWVAWADYGRFWAAVVHAHLRARR